MTWERFTTWLTNVSHNPVFISIVSILSGLVSVLIIISQTSVGRRALLELRKLGRKTQDKVTEIDGKVSSRLKTVDNRLQELKVEKDKFFKEAEDKFKVFYNQFDFYETEIIETLKLIPNKKVQERVELIESGWKDKKKEIEDFVGITYSEMTNKISDLEKQIEELKDGRVIDNSRESKEI